MSKAIWRAIVIFLFVLTLWFSIAAVSRLWEYYRLNVRLPIEVTRMEVEMLNGSKYAVKVYFTYDYQGKNYSGQYSLKEPFFLNRYAAEDQIKKWQNKKWTCWINSKKPHTVSLEKKFPQKKIIYAFLLLVLFLYFVYLEAFSRRS